MENVRPAANDPILIIGELMTACKGMGMTLRLEFTRGGVQTWLHPVELSGNDPAGYPDAAHSSLGELKKWVVERLAARVKDLENQAAHRREDAESAGRMLKMLL